MLEFLLNFHYKNTETSLGVSSVALNTKRRGLMRFKVMRRFRRSLGKRWLWLKTIFVWKSTDGSQFPEFFIGASKEQQPQMLLSLCKTSQGDEKYNDLTMFDITKMKVRIGAILYNNTDAEVSRLLRSIEYSSLPSNVSINVAILNNGQPRAAPVCDSLVPKRSMPKLGPDTLRVAHNKRPVASFAQRFYFAETRW